MTVKLLVDWKDPRSGKEYRALNLLTTDAATETGLVSDYQAETNLTGGTAWSTPAAADSTDRSEWLRETPLTIASIGVPFIIPPGDGAAVGLQFTGTAGAFTLSAAILTNAWNALKGCWMYLTASFGGSRCPAGWYWAVFSSDTAGIVYTDTYVSGKPVRPSSPVEFSIDLTGRLTSTTSEVTGPTGFTLRGGLMGKSGALKAHLRGIGNATANKSYRMYLGSTVVQFLQPVTTSPNWEMLVSTCNQGSESLQTSSRQIIPTGVGGAGAVMVGGESTSVDTSIDQNLSISMQISTTAACAALLHADASVTYGD